jgi:hypothetical protein
MAISEFTKFKKLIDNYITKLEGIDTFFQKKIDKQSSDYADARTDWIKAYESRYGTIKLCDDYGCPAGNTDDNEKFPHTQLSRIDAIYKDVAAIRNRCNLINPTIKMMETDIKNSFKNTNLEINESKNNYESADEKYELGKNLNSATGILKMDSYDRNIEENFYIMYYLLSYGVLGFFIYKLLKL